jgi:hypothetical protein
MSWRELPIPSSTLTKLVSLVVSLVVTLAYGEKGNAEYRWARWWES